MTGFIVERSHEAVDAAGRRIDDLDRASVSARVFEQRFTAARMARNYLRLYEDVAAIDAEHASGRGRRADGRRRLLN